MGPSDITRKVLVSWGGEDVFNEALALAQTGKVLRADYDPASGVVSGEVLNSAGGYVRTSFHLRDNGTIESRCPCYDNRERGLVCKHVIALGAMIMLRRTDPAREERYRREQAAAARAQNAASNAIRRSSRGTPTRMALGWSNSFADEFYLDGVNVSVYFVGRDGVKRPPESIAPTESLALSTADDTLLSILEDACEGRLAARIRLSRADFLNVLELLPHGGAVKTVLKAEFSEASGEFNLFARAELPPEYDAKDVRFLVAGNIGYVYSARRFFKMANVLPGPFQSIYERSERITREMMPAFIKENLPTLRRFIEVEMSPTEDMFEFRPGMPVVRLEVRGSRASISARMSFKYGSKEVALGSLPTGEGNVCLPDAEDVLLYHTRNLLFESNAASQMTSRGFAYQTAKINPGSIPCDTFDTVDRRSMLNFLGSGVPYLRRQGWRIELVGQLEEIIDEMPLIVPVVKVNDAPRGAFDVGITFDAGDREVPLADVQRAINKCEAFIRYGDDTYLIDCEAISSMREVFSDCSEQGGASAGKFRIASIYAPFVKSSLECLDGVDIDDDKAPNWRENATARNHDKNAKFEAVPLGELENVLRPYQKNGVYWMHFLEKSGLCGLLADEMGLGKTLQTLTWLSLERADKASRGKPAIVVCPTSLVENWNREAAKFVPWMKRLVVSGADRASVFKDIPSADLVITSYALLQRDLSAAYEGVEFSVAVIDEAQHIKNRGTQNARAVKQLMAGQKLALTGTPVENSVADVWSIFDFLMPEYLGSYEEFRYKTEQPIANGGRTGAAAQDKLRRKLHPFILRRLKQEVAKDLPEKIIRTEFCTMSDEQQRLYNSTLAKVRDKIGAMVRDKGFAKSKFEILALLMRLREISCHPMLLKDYREKHAGTVKNLEGISGKTAAFFELLEEAMSGGHRVLVFSQFVQMLGILRKELEKRGIKYCYLDGSTKNRLDECSRFNTDRTIPLFLISLHAGGTGLTLTGADMVVHFDPWWNPAVEDQATDRAHRIGQKKTVYVVKMISADTVEERVLALQKKKKLVIDATVGTTDAQAMEKLSYDDIKQIIGL